MLGLALIVVVVASPVFAEVIAPHAPLEQDLNISKPPSAWIDGGNWAYPLGTDNLGRDLYSRIIYGSRVSLTVCFIGVLIAGPLGLGLGMIAGYTGGRADGVISTATT